MDKLNETIKGMAEGYFAITSRPISTMTVEEYISFYNLAKSCSFTPVTNTCPIDTGNTQLAMPVPKSTVVLPETGNTSVSQTDTRNTVEENADKETETEHGLTFNKEPGQGTEGNVANFNARAEQKQSSKNTMLAMLRSVSG